MHAHYAWITKTYGLYSFHNALQVPNLSGVVASVCTPLPTCTQQLPTSLDQQCWELLCPFACSLRNCSEVWQRRWPWGNQTQLLNVCHLVPFLLPTSLRIQSFLLADHGEGQLCSSIFHLIVTDCCLWTVNMYFICRFSDALSYMMSCKMKNRSSFGYYNSIYSSANGQKLANISNYRYKFILFLVKTGKIDQALNVITMPPSAVLPNDVLNTTSKGKRFSGRLQKMVLNQCRFLGNWPPTPSLSHRFALSEK